MAITCSVRWDYRKHYLPTDRYSTGFQTISFSSDGSNPISNSSYNDTDNEFESVSITLDNPLPANVGGVFYVTGCLAGGGLIPPNSRYGDIISGNIITLPGQASNLWNRVIRLYEVDSPDAAVAVSANGLYYKDLDGNWHDIVSQDIVATAQEVSNLPADVEFNGWTFEHEVIKGSDDKYYDLSGKEVFSNLPSGVIPTTKIIAPSNDGSGELSGGVFEGSDGSYYDVDGVHILENLPSGVVPVENFGDVYQGNDSNYYDVHGNPVMENLPSGVEIVGYDSSTGNYEGSDGKNYDIHGDEVEDTPECDGVLLTFTPSIRLTIDCVDIFGNQQNIGADIQIGQSSLDFASLFNFNYIRQINRITARSLGSATESVGNGILRIRGSVVGAKVAVDVEGVDVDAVLGTYEVCACNFSMCDRFATPILNNDLPLGLANHTNLDVGYYVLNQFLSFQWEGFNDVFPYCCPDYNNDEKGSGSTPNPNEDKDMSKLIESIDKLTEAVQGLSILVEVVVSPAEDVNVYNRRFHYNDGDGVSGFSS